jgi:elongation factor Ts
MVSLCCETDFVARSDEFVATADALAAKELAGDLGEAPSELEELGLKLGEKIHITDRVVLESDHVGDYVHSTGKIGVLVALDGGSDDLARDIAMHTAAMNPAVISPEEVSAEAIEKESELWKDDLAKSGKPEDMWEKIMMGKENKFRSGLALLKQDFVKEPGQKVEQVLGDAKVKEFHRFAI